MDTLLKLLVESESASERAELAEAIRGLAGMDDYLFTGIVILVVAMLAIGAATVWHEVRIARLQQRLAKRE